MSNSALLTDTVPKLFQVTPSVEYCQPPLPTTAVIAMPLSAPASTSAQVAPVRIVLTVVPAEALFSSVALSVMLAPLFTVGASLIGVTLKVKVLGVLSKPPKLSCTLKLKLA